MCSDYQFLPCVLCEAVRDLVRLRKEKKALMLGKVSFDKNKKAEMKNLTTMLFKASSINFHDPQQKVDLIIIY